MKTKKLPKTDSIQKLARFWDKHDLTDFEDELEEVAKPVFARVPNHKESIELKLQTREANAVKRLAELKGISQGELVRQWVVEKLGRPNLRGPAKG